MKKSKKTNTKFDINKKTKDKKSNESKNRSAKKRPETHLKKG